MDEGLDQDKKEFETFTFKELLEMEDQFDDIHPEEKQKIDKVGKFRRMSMALVDKLESNKDKDKDRRKSTPNAHVNGIPKSKSVYDQGDLWVQYINEEEE